MSLSKLRLVQLGGMILFVVAVALLVILSAGKVNVAVTPADVASADGGYGAKTDYSDYGAAKHISGMFIADENKSSEPTFGGSSAPSLVNGCLDLGGTMACFYGSAWSTASTSCSFKLPSSTSTLQYAAAQVRNQQGTTNWGEWGWSRDLMSTSTSLGAGALSATINTVLVASSTGSSLNNVNPAFILPANGYLTFKQGSTTPTGVTGRCSAEVITL